MMDFYLIGSLRFFTKLDMASYTLQLLELNLSVCCTQSYVSCTYLYYEHGSEYNTVSYSNLTTMNEFSSLNSSNFLSCLNLPYVPSVIYIPYVSQVPYLLSHLTYSCSMCPTCLTCAISSSTSTWPCNIHCMKSVRILSYSGPHFSRIFPYSVWMWENARKTRTRITPNTDTFHAVIAHFEWNYSSMSIQCLNIWDKLLTLF